MNNKKEWKRPVLQMMQFAPNEYVAACGDTNKVYYFKCDAVAGTLYYYSQSDGTIDGTYTGSGKATRLGNYHPCGATHEASVTSDFFDGFVDRNGNGRCDTGEEVIVWRGEYNNNGHATTSLNMNEWTTGKS